MTAQKMTIQNLVRNMFKAIIQNLSEEEYSLLQIPKYRIFKRREFSSIYKTLLLFLTRLSIPKSFPEHQKEILTTFDDWYKLAYRKKESIKRVIDKDLLRFKKLTRLDQKKPFEKLSQYIAELFEKKSNKLLYMVLLERRMGTLFENFINTGKQIEIIHDPEEINVIEKLKETKKKN